MNWSVLNVRLLPILETDIQTLIFDCSAVAIISKKTTVYERPGRVHLQLPSHTDISITLKEHSKRLELYLNAVKTNLFFFDWVDGSYNVGWRYVNKCIQACIYTSLRDACPILTKI